MPKHYCDYCDVYLTHDSTSVRKAHNTGRNHLQNVKEYYASLGHDKAQNIIDQITSAFESGGGPPAGSYNFPPQFGAAPGFGNAPPAFNGIPPGMPPYPGIGGFNGPPGMGSAPPFPPQAGMMPPGGAFPGGVPPFPPSASGQPPFPPNASGQPPFPPNANIQPPFPPNLNGQPPFPPQNFMAGPPGSAQSPPLSAGGVSSQGYGSPANPGGNQASSGPNAIHPDRLRMMGQ